MEVVLENYSKSELIALVLEHQKQASILEKKNAHQQNEITFLKYRIEQLNRIAYGQKRERFESKDNPQPMLPFKMEQEQQQALEKEVVQKISYERKKNSSNHKGRQPLPEHLPVEEIKIYPEGDLSQMIQIGEEITDELEYQPARYYIKRYIRYKYAPKNGEGVLIGKLPQRAIDKCIAGSGLLASILVDKYMDHLPLYRQIQRFKRENIPIASSTIEGWAKQSLDFLQILYKHLITTTRAKGYLQADETPIKVLDKDKKGSCHRGYYWAYHSPIDRTVLFDYQPGRGTNAALEVLSGFKGYLQTDGYGVYDSIGEGKNVTHLNCWAHARREFEKAQSNDQHRATKALLFIQALYKVEREAKEGNLDAAQRKELRLDKSLPIINEFGKWMTDEIKSGEILPKSQIGKAMGYSLNRWDNLSVYLNDGNLEIDNNLIENVIRPIAIGRKNYLFAGSHDAAKRAACIYSFFAICKNHQVNPYQWLKYVFDNLLETKITELDKLYPQNYKTAIEKQKQLSN